MSKDEQQRALVPRLRFPEFRDMPGWNEDVLTGLCDINPDHDGLPESFYYIDLESVEAGELRNLRHIDRESAPSRAQRYLSDGDIIFQTVRPYQRNNLLFNFGGADDYVASTGYAQLRARENVGFLYQLIHTDSFVTRVLAKCTGSNYPAINSSGLAFVSIWIPPDSAEQQKIADCLGSLDDLVTAEGRKLAALRDHKKGLMQQLFPRVGETRPRRRFPEFRNKGDWEPNTLGDIVDISKGKGIAKADVIDGGLTPCIRYAELYTTYGEIITDVRSCTNVSIDNLVLSEAGDVIVPASGESKDDIATCACVVDAGVALGSDLNVLRSEINGRFFSYYLKGAKRAELAKVAQGDTVAHLYPSQISQLTIAIPSDSDEQHRIADCLSTLDTLIVAQAKKLDALLTYKRGLMQQLFPASEDHP